MTAGNRMRWWVAAAAAIVMFAQLGAARLFDEDEPKNAACAKEMLARGDWVVPTYNHGLRADKPVLLYWLMMPAYAVFGVNEFSARFWSATLGLGTVLLTLRIGRGWFGGEAGTWAAWMLIGSPLFVALCRAATPESTLVFFTMLIFLCRLHADGLLDRTDTPQVKLRPLPLFAAYALMGLAVLTKGPVGFLLPAATLWIFDTCRTAAEYPSFAAGTWRDRLWALVAACSPRATWERIVRQRLIEGTAVMLLVALPWYVWVWQRTDGAWVEGFLGRHNVNRFLNPMENHRGPLWYYVISTLAATFPWSVLLPGAILYLLGGLRGTSAPGDPSKSPAESAPAPAAGRLPELFAACWAGTFFLFYSLASTKLPHYVLPAFPALALLVGNFAAALRSGAAELPNWLWRTVYGITATAGIGIAIGLYVAATKFLPGLEWLALVGLIPVALAATAWIAARRHGPGEAVPVWAYGGAAFVLVLVSLLPGLLNPHQTSEPVFAALGHDPKTKLVAIRSFQTALAFYEPGGTAVYGSHTVKDGLELVRGNDANAVLVRADVADEVRRGLPDPEAWREAGRWRRFLRDDTLILLRRGAPQTAADPTRDRPRN